MYSREWLFKEAWKRGATKCAQSSLCIYKNPEWLRRDTFFFFSVSVTSILWHGQTLCVLQCPWFRLAYFSNNKLYQGGMWGCFLWALSAPLKKAKGWTVGDYRVNHEWVFLSRVCDGSRHLTNDAANIHACPLRGGSAKTVWPTMMVLTGQTNTKFEITHTYNKWSSTETLKQMHTDIRPD